MITDKTKNIYLAHQYGDESHFKALYECAAAYGYSVSPQIILSIPSIMKTSLDAILRGEVLVGFKIFFEKMFWRLRFRFLKNQIIIIGLAPYDGMMLRYDKVIHNNITYYFTSHTVWDGTDYPRGSIRNRKRFEDIIRKDMKGVFCVSQRSEREIKSINPNTSVVNHSINYYSYRKRTESSNRAKKLIFLGSFIDRKNVPMILNWIRNNSSADITMDFAGKGKYEKEIIKLANEDKRVHLLGKVDKTWIQQNLCNYDYMVLPSEKEPFGIVLIEALASGVPCLVSNADGPLEIITDNETGFVFDLSNRDISFAKTMKRALSISNSEEKRMRINAINAGKKYDTGEIIKKWIALIDG